VYAIGGINSENLQDVMKCGAAGGCIMSGLMRGEWIEEADI
jgi:thiamine-phosphate pyrophosphorylase